MNAKVSRMSFLLPFLSIGCDGWPGGSGCPEYCPRGGSDPACNLDNCSCDFDQKEDDNHECCVQVGGACWVPPDAESECAAEISQSSPAVAIIPALNAQRAGDGSTDIKICDSVEYTWAYYNAMAGTLEPPTTGQAPIFSLWEYDHKSEAAFIPRPWGQVLPCEDDKQVVATNFFADPETNVFPVTFEAELSPLPQSAQPQFVSIRADKPSDLSNCNGPLQVGEDFDEFD